jgi:hypothetical protein
MIILQSVKSCSGALVKKQVFMYTVFAPRVQEFVMTKDALSRVAFSGEPRELWFVVFDALMSPEKADLQKTIDIVKQTTDEWPEDFRYGLEGLKAYRDYYGNKLYHLTPQQRRKYEEYDEEWTLDLLDQMHRRKYGVACRDAPEQELE